MKKLELVVDETLAGKSLELILKEILGFTKKQISRAKFRENGICINGEQRRISHIAVPGEVLQVCLEEEREDTGKVEPVFEKPDILYEDEDLIVLNKPGGMPCHPGRGHYEDSLANRLAGYYKEKGENALIRAVGRLDRDTSGIMVFAKGQMAAARLFKQKEDGSFRKEYLAVVQGEFKESEGRIMEPIGKIPGEKMRMQVDSDGKSAETIYEVLKSWDGYSLVRCNIRTGRTHQIRVHMAWLGHPLLGDVLYGDGKNLLFDGLALHAWKAEFTQPFSKEKIRIQVLPEWEIE